MLPCEKLEIYEEASYNSEDPFSRGLLILTKFRIIYKFQDQQQLKKLKLSDNFFNIPLFYIKNVTKKRKNITQGNHFKKAQMVHTRHHYVTNG